jgi:diguanylate cyclase
MKMTFYDILNTTPIGHLVIDKDYIIIYINKILCVWSTVLSEESIGKNLLELYPHLNKDKYKTRIDSIFEGGPPVVFSTQLHGNIIPGKLPNGKERKQNTTINKFVDKNTGEIFAVFSIQDETGLSSTLDEYRETLDKLRNEIKNRQKAEDELALKIREINELNDKLQDKVIRDSLTNLYNHEYFTLTMNRDFQLAIREKKDLSCLMIDIDHFKKINDTFGHQFGDYVIITTCKIITEAVRTTDVPARYGGEEFAVILPNTSLHSAAIVANRIKMNIDKFNFSKFGIETNITVSMGLSSIKSSSVTDSISLIRKSDEALYMSKQNGRNQITLG